MMVRVERLLVSAYWDYIGETAANDTPHNNCYNFAGCRGLIA
jgi:hypothetical protein